MSGHIDKLQTDYETDGRTNERAWHSLQFYYHFYSKGDAWTGGNDFENEGEFRWSSGSPFSGYTKWGVNNPDNYGGSENCVHLINYSFAWNDNYCGAKKQCVCEKELEER